MTDTSLQPLHLTVVFMLVELGLLVLVGIGLHAMAVGREVIWECRWRWPHDLAAAYAKLRAAELTQLATWQRIGRKAAAFARSNMELARRAATSPSSARRGTA